MKRSSSITGLAACGLLSLAVPSFCAPASSGALREAFYTQATNHFQKAHFLKPGEPKEPEVSFTLAPLLIQETLGAESKPENDLFGALDITNGVLALDLARPTVYAAVDTVPINRVARNRFTYLWCYSLRASGGGTLSLQGVRITADAKGFPVIWEVLADPVGPVPVYVARSVEDLAAKEYGQPLRGRRHAVESKTSRGHDVIVPRVLDDGPAPMGPILYLKTGSRAAASLACRCMKPQARSLLSTSEYHLVPLTLELKVLLAASFGGNGDFFPLESGELEKRLRLPAKF